MPKSDDETGDENDLQEQLREFMEVAHRPVAPLSPSELRKIRLLIDKTEKSEWLWKRIKVILPWMISLLASMAAGWKWLVETIGPHWK